MCILDLIGLSDGFTNFYSTNIRIFITIFFLGFRMFDCNQNIQKNAVISGNTLSFKKDALNNFEFVKTGFVDSVFDPTSS